MGTVKSFGVEFGFEHGLECVRKEVFERRLDVFGSLDVVVCDEFFNLGFR